MSHLVKELKRSKYRLLGLVGQGQFGRVYCASHRKTGRLVALKELDKQRFPTHKFLRELRFLLSLQHPNIVTCHALEHTPTGRYLVMDYCEGGTLRGLMEEDVRLHPAQCLKLVVDVLSGLDHAHSRGIVHCDIKPENILLTLQADGWTARVSDFGIARLHQESADGDGGNTGSPAYMAPERFYGQYAATSDLYAVGILLFELLVGYRPFSGTPIAMMSAHLNNPVKIPSTVPTALHSVLLTALQKLPARRFQSAAQMVTAVQAAIAEAMPEFEQAWSKARFLRSPIVSPIGVCTYIQQEALQAEVQQLVPRSAQVPQVSQPPLPPMKVQMEAIAAVVSTSTPASAERDERVYQLCNHYIGCRSYPEGLLTSEGTPVEQGKRSRLASVRLPKVVKSLLVRPQGCFALTQRSIYRLSLDLFQQGQTQQGQPPNGHNLASFKPAVPELVAEFSRDFLATIEAKGRWMVVAVLEPDNVTSALSFWKLSRMQSIKSGGRHGNAAQAPRSTAQVFHLAMPDSRYVVAFSHLVDQSTNSYITGVLLEIFTRRGDRVNGFSLPIPLRQVLSSKVPYNLLALEPGQTHSVLLIDLKPLKIVRIGLEIVPILLAAASWGYILVAADGHMIVLDRYGVVLGHIAGPAHPTAIAVLEPYGLLVATWNDGRGDLYTIDLQQPDSGLVF
ncbi:MAG: serine/threonine protein kinase [Stenomitos rutilans HA7619-LM2]|nr:serine/threonine protein kinase [Stenomitos rutilans HA7619-LM2]